MKNLFKYTFLFLLSLVCSYSFAAENTASATTAETVTFEIAGDAGTYKFFYPEQKVIKHNGYDVTKVTMNVTATTGTSALVTIQVEADNSYSDKITVLAYGYKNTIDLEEDGPTLINYVIPIIKGGNQTSQLSLN